MNEKPILLLVEEGLVTPSEQNLIERAVLIGQVETIQLYSLGVHTFNQDSLSWKHRIDTTRNLMPPIALKQFEDDPFPDALVGDGALFVRGTDQPAFDFTFEGDTIIKAMAHAWMYIDQEDGTMGILRIRETSPVGQVLSDQGLHRRDIDWSEVVGHWVRQDRPLTLKPGNRYEFIFETKGNIIDLLEVRDVNQNTLSTIPSLNFQAFNGMILER